MCKSFPTFEVGKFRQFRMDENIAITDEKFIPLMERVREMFLEFGIKNLNMDEISRKLGISKKTLYRYVDSKESLIGKIFDFEFMQWSLFIEQLGKRPISAIDKLFEVSLRVLEELKRYNSMLLFELKKYYEQLYNENMARNRAFIQDKMKSNLEQGISEGLYRNDLNIDLVVTVYVNSLVETHNYVLSKADNVTFEQLFEVMFDHHIRAISNHEGLAYYENRKKEITNYLIKEQPR